MRKFLDKICLTIILFILSAQSISLAENKAVNYSPEEALIVDEGIYLEQDIVDYMIDVNNHYATKKEAPKIGLILVNLLEEEAIEYYVDKILVEYDLKEKYIENGVLLFVSVNNGIYKIAVGDYLLDWFDDSYLEYLVDELRESFDIEDYSKGIFTVVENIKTTLDIIYEYDAFVSDYEIKNSDLLITTDYEEDDYTFYFIIGLIIVVFIYIGISKNSFSDSSENNFNENNKEPKQKQKTDLNINKDKSKKSNDDKKEKKKSKDLNKNIVIDDEFVDYKVVNNDIYDKQFNVEINSVNSMEIDLNNLNYLNSNNINDVNDNLLDNINIDNMFVNNIDNRFVNPINNIGSNYEISSQNIGEIEEYLLSKTNKK